MKKILTFTEGQSNAELGNCGFFSILFYNFLSIIFYQKQVVLVVLGPKKAVFRAGHFRFFLLKKIFLTENTPSAQL